MLSTNDTIVLCGLVLLCILLIILLRFIQKQKNKKQLHVSFIILFTLMFIWLGCMILQLLFMNKFNINIKYFFNIYYISLCFLPVAFLYMAFCFARGSIEIKRVHLLLLIIPMLSVILMWTNDFHHLLYKEYSINVSTEYGWYFYVHTIYTYLLFGISIITLLKYSIKNSGFFSKQAILLFIGTLVPLIVNVLGSFQIIEISIYTTPITFAVTIICFSLGILKFDLFKITPIALQRIVDRMSDSYIILNEDNIITDFNKTFLTTFNLKDANVRNVNLFDLISYKNKNIVDNTILKNSLEEVKNSTKTIYFDKEFPAYKKFFHIEINTITSKQSFLGTLILFKDITQHMQDMQTIKDTQESLMEGERLASLGQLIGGIAHNLKTPIMSISGAAEGLQDLINEYDSSIDDPTVNSQDHHDIAKDMSEWIVKIRNYTEYMSDVITAVKGQAVAMSNDEENNFTVSELVKRVTILMKHELKNAIITLNTSVNVDDNLVIKGDVNNLVQVINNMIANAIQAYNGKENESIEFTITKDSNNVIFSIEDHAGGLPEKVKDKLFKEMITTKGKNGTGLGLYMSYSTIKAHFGGNITFDSRTGEGTKFNIILPL